MNIISTDIGIPSHQKLTYEINMISRETNPRKDEMTIAPQRTVIDNTDTLNTIQEAHSESKPVNRKRKRIIEHDDTDDETSEPIINRGPIEYQEILEHDDIDEHGNIRDLIDYSDRRSHKRHRYDSDSESNDDEDYDLDESHFDKEYQTYVKTLSPADITLLNSLEQELKEFTQENTKPIKYRILMMKAPIKVKVLAMEKLKTLSTLEKSSPDYGYEWSTLNYLLNLPWETYIDLPVKKSDGLDAIHAFLNQATTFLDTITYGQFKAKSTLLLELGSYLENPDGHGFVLGIKGPPGSGKTTLIDKGLSKLLHRPFFRIDLGGAKHSDSLFGTRKVFERSDLGDLSKALIDGQCLNPIFLFDELDKVSTSEYGLEVIHALNDLTDRSRNQALLDQYLGIHLDFSRAIFVFTYNDNTKIPETLRNRIHEIEIEPYSVHDKIQMSKTFFLPKAGLSLNFQTDQIHFEDSALKWIIKNHTSGELGARQLETQIKKIIQKINWMRLTSGHKELNNYHCASVANLKFPLKITLKLVKQLLSGSD